MTNQITKRPTADISPRKVALIAGLGLLFMALLFWRAIKGFPSESDPSESESPDAQLTEQRLTQPTTLVP